MFPFGNDTFWLSFRKQITRNELIVKYSTNQKQNPKAMAKKKAKIYDEAELIEIFGLERLGGNDAHPLMKEWTQISAATLIPSEEYLFDYITEDLVNKIVGWNEEMLKMNFISPVLILGHIKETKAYKTYYENTIEATVDGYFLKTKADMMIAKGILERPKTPYFYFQEYKKVKEPKRDVTAQVLEAFLISQENNKNGKPLYGCTVSGKFWEFMIMEHRTYCISKSYDCTEKEDLLKIIAILRKFKVILETTLLD
ncbi:MAG: hypothetical protein EAZ55_03410 [Cytophagales bacterium]|nr:MAG: hypothetical protein EAZ55_03410 [Cytophagales bacterium]